MKKFILLILAFLMLALLISCDEGEVEQCMVDEGTAETVKMVAVIKNIAEKIEVEVIEGEYGASGIYLVNFSSDTAFLDSKGNCVSASDLKIGDIVEITYGGQVAMSYPPQIFAKAIQIK